MINNFLNILKHTIKYILLCILSIIILLIMIYITDPKIIN